MWDKDKDLNSKRSSAKPIWIWRCCNVLASIFRRFSASPLLIGLISIAVLWTAVFIGMANIKLWSNDNHSKVPPGWKPPPPAPRNLAFEQRIGMGKHPHDKTEDAASLAANSAHGFNTLASEKIGVGIRQLPDTVPNSCRKAESESVRQLMPSVSVIVAFHNEHFTTLARTVTSILHRTPERILKEVLLVDDGSNKPDLLVRVSDFMTKSAALVKTRLIRLEDHSGIVGARMVGARNASGDVLVFMESHAEPNTGWIEPLLTLIEAGKKNGDSLTIAVPVVDIIDDETFAYRASPAIRGGFDWDLVFRWEHKGEAQPLIENGVEYMQSPAFSGGVFAVDRHQFFDMGAYDETMHEWGAENIELALRAGMCGGRVLVTPCSRVGHVFRRRPPVAITSHPGPGTDDASYWFAYNALRTALVWLVDPEDKSDEGVYLKYFYSSIPEAQQIAAGDVSPRRGLRKKLKCKSFKWFLTSLYPDHPSPPSLATVGETHQFNLEKPVVELTVDKEGKNTLEGYISRSRRSGHLFHVVSGLCVTLSDKAPVRNVPEQNLPGSSNSYTCLTLTRCENLKSQRWFETWQGDMVLTRAGCLAWSAAYSPTVVIALCPSLAPAKPKETIDQPRKILKSTKWRWLDGMTASQLQVTVPDSSLSEKCLVARHFETVCNDGRCGVNQTAPPPVEHNVCSKGFGDPSEVLLEPCTSDHNQLFQLLDF